MQNNKISFEDAFGATQEEEIQKPKQSISFEDAFGAKDDSPDFIPGVQRGVQNLQASLYGAGALAGSGLKKLGAESVGQTIQDFGMEGYRRNIEEAKQFPKKHSFKDIYTGKTGVGGAIDWAQGTLGELVPSMAEAALGAVIGSAVAPGPGTVTGALAGRTILKKGIEKTIQQAMKRGIGDLTESQLRKQVTRQALKKLGGKAGIAGAVMPMESGGMYADLLESKGIDAPETALLFGALSTSLEFIPGGNAKLVDNFVDALSKGSTGMVKKSAKELLTGIPSEALQEGGQELFSILNTVANTDEKLLTAENIEQIIESMAAGAVGGGAGAVVQAGLSSQAQEVGPEKTPQELELDRRASNILTQDKEVIGQSVQKLNDNIKSNQEILNDYQKLDAKARELNIEPTELIDQILVDNKNNENLITKINAGITEQAKLTQKEYEQLPPEEKAVKDIADKLNAQRVAAAQKINEDIKTIDKRASIATKQYQQEKDPEKKKVIANRVFTLRAEKNNLLDRQLIQQTDQVKEFAAPKKADEIRKEREDFYNKLGLGDVSKDAAESAKVFESRAAQQEEILQQILQEKDLQKRQELQNTYNKIFQTFERDPQEAAKTFEYQDLSLFDKATQQRIREAQESAEVITDPQILAQAIGKPEQIDTLVQMGITDPDMQVQQIVNDAIIQKVNIAEMLEAKGRTEEAAVFRSQAEEAGNNLKAVGGVQTARAVDTALQGTQAPEEVLDEAEKSLFIDEQQVSEAPQIQVIEDQEALENQVKADKDYIRELPEGFRLDEVNTPEGIIYQVYDTQGTKDILIGEDWTIDEVLEKAGIKIESKATTTLHDTLIQAKQDPGVVGQLSEFMSQFIPESKLDIPVTIDPTARAAYYSAKTGITLRDPSKLTTSLHEIVHAVTVREMNANKDIKNKVTSLMSIVESAAIRAGHLTPKQINDIKSAGGSKAFKDKFKADAAINRVRPLSYALLNEYEFLSQAFSSPQVQGFMKSIRTTQEERGKFRTLWDDFIQLIMNSLGIDQTHKTAFGEALKLTAELAQANIEKTTQLKAPETRISYEALTEADDQVISQKIPQAEYAEVHVQKNNLVKDLAQQARIKLTEVKLLADKALGPISTRLKNVDPELAQHLRWLDFNTSQKIIDTLKTAKPLLDATKVMSSEDKSAWNWARLNSDEGKIEQLAQKYNLTADQNALREKLNKIREEAIEVGYDVGFIEEYWPRVIKDQEGFLQATQEISQRPVFTEAIRAQAKKLGLSQEQFEREFPEIKADIISNLILGQPTGIGGPGNIQARVFETIPKEYAPFYMDADAALMQYVYSMTKKIEARKFFGKVPKRISDLKSSSKRKQADLLKLEQLADMARAENPEVLPDYEDRIIRLNEDLAGINEELDAYKLQRDYTENIGSYIDRLMIDGKIQKKDEKVVRDILDARFHEHGTTGIINAYKNLSYIDTMGSPLSAITQIGDLAWAMYVGKVWTPRGLSNTVKNVTNAIFNKSGVTKEDLGIERIAQEFADGTTLSRGVSKVFKAVGLEKMDSIGKEALINNALDQFKVQAKADPEALAKSIRPTFGKKATDVVQEILADNPSDNVKMLLYSRLLDFQPVALSEMPEYYLNSGNGRVFYMLKTYTIKQFDVFRKEVIHNLKSKDPQQKLQGITNMVQLMALLTLANASADEIKDFMLGKETKFSDNVIENFLTLGGASRFTRMQVTREGFGSALAQQVLPPMKFINAASKDMQEGYSDYVSGDTSNFEHARIIDSIPGLGKLYYWHFGRGDENKKSLAEKDFAEAGKDVRLFKKQLENSDDKRLFIQSNMDRFKQMKLHGNFQAALNRNKAVINKLEKIPSTENVQTRLGQLKAQREQILERYLDVAETL